MVDICKRNKIYPVNNLKYKRKTFHGDFTYIKNEKKSQIDYLKGRNFRGYLFSRVEKKMHSAGIYFREISKNSRNSRKLVLIMTHEGKETFQCYIISRKKISHHIMPSEQGEINKSTQNIHPSINHLKEDFANIYTSDDNNLKANLINLSSNIYILFLTIQ